MATHHAPSPVDSQVVLEEVMQGKGLGLAAAARIAGVSAETAWRWLSHGVRRPDGQRVRLEAARVGCRWRTSRAAVERFLRAING
jgi:hypothetical protein